MERPRSQVARVKMTDFLTYYTSSYNLNVKFHKSASLKKALNR